MKINVGFGRSTAQKAVSSANKHYLDWSKEHNINSIKTLTDYYNVKYNDTERYALLKNYVSSVDTGMLSPLTSFDKYEKYYSRVQNELIGLTTASGIKIKSQSKHLLSVFLVLKMTLHITINQEVEYLYLILKIL
ncbi:hypothetical protein [Ruminococcus sp.]|jgi:minor capsid 2 protein|uniref:hypothetical protein n=1 Tax=Ruminococcus sp. TaxID=41978 RepID=UPI0025EE32D2|nr:hypothetical protein [Ruminococcus sp.]